MARKPDPNRDGVTLVVNGPTGDVPDGGFEEIRDDPSWPGARIIVPTVGPDDAQGSAVPVEPTAKRIGFDAEVTTALIHRLCQRVMELEEATVGLVAALTRYRVQHDQQRWSHDRPCDCEMCEQADEAIKAVKGGA